MYIEKDRNTLMLNCDKSSTSVEPFFLRLNLTKTSFLFFCI